MNTVQLTNPAQTARTAAFANALFTTRKTATTAIPHPTGLSADLFSSRGANSVAFGQNYTATPQELNDVQNAIRGGNDRTFAANYRAPSSVSKALRDIAEGRNTLQPISDLATGITKARNLRALLTPGAVLKTPDAYHDEAEQFFDEIRQELPPVLETLGKLGVSKAGQGVFTEWVAQIAPALQMMGFPDAIAHAAQVTRLAAIRASQAGGDATRVLQAALVGFIHDPKLAGVPENLATHPVVASALVADTLDHNPELKTKLAGFLITEDRKTAYQDFRDSLVDAAGINNDSEWVNRNIILAGLTKKGTDIETLEPTFWQRFNALATGRKPMAYPRLQEKRLADVRFDTGLVSLSQAATATAFQATLDAFPKADWGKSTQHQLDDILLGKLDADAVDKVRAALTFTQAASPVQVSALALANNSEALTNPLAKATARALAEADNTLLTAHKIISSGWDPTPMDRLLSFMRSYEHNILALPAATQPRMREWQRDMNRSILAAAGDLTGVNHWQSEWDALPIAGQIEKSRAAIQTPASWMQSPAKADGDTPVDYASLTANLIGKPTPDPADQTRKFKAETGVKEMVAALQARYNEALVKSPAMFNI